jgi:ComF family protein
LTSIRSWAVYDGPVRNALLRLKYKRDLGLGDALSVNLIECYQGYNWSIDMVIPVPLGAVREANRGYNQAALLARPFAWGVGLYYNPKALIRVRETDSQVDLSYSGRRKNVQNAFKARSEIVSGKNVMVVDDITTSGSTLDACAAALFEANAEHVYGLTLARTIFSHPDNP